MKRLRPVLLVILSCTLLGNLASAEKPNDEPTLVAEQELLDELKAAPKENKDREGKLRELYVQAGAKPDEITLQEVKPRREGGLVQHNVIVKKKGANDSVIVVGGHLDKVPPGSGVIDDWSGASLAANLYQTLRPLETKHTFVFIGFAHEELGLLGSQTYVASLSNEERKHIKAMVNLECLGVDDPFIWTNGSTDSLEKIAHRVADEHKLPLRDHVILGVGADSIPFERVGIPNITFDGLPVERLRLIHSENDDFSNINPAAYVNAYRLTTQFLVTLDRELAENGKEPGPKDARSESQKVDD